MCSLHHPHKDALSPLPMRAGTRTHAPSRALACSLSLHIHDTRALGTTLVKWLVIAEPRHGCDRGSTRENNKAGAREEKGSRQTQKKASILTLAAVANAFTSPFLMPPPLPMPPPTRFSFLLLAVASQGFLVNADTAQRSSTVRSSNARAGRRREARALREQERRKAYVLGRRQTALPRTRT